MKNFNFQKMIVVAPKPIYPNDKILATSVGAKNIISKSKNFDNLESALKNIDVVIATSARFRNKNIKHIQLEDLKKIDYKKKVAFLFGSEASGRPMLKLSLWPTPILTPFPLNLPPWYSIFTPLHLLKRLPWMARVLTHGTTKQDKAKQDNARQDKTS